MVTIFITVVRIINHTTVYYLIPKHYCFIQRINHFYRFDLVMSERGDVTMRYMSKMLCESDYWKLCRS